MDEAERTRRQKELIECIGRQNERDGYQPVAARILGLLMVMDKEEYTFDEIVEEMQISKSSASNALKILELREVIEYVTYPGDRKRYFRFISTDICKMVDEVEKKMLRNLEILRSVIELKKDSNSRNTLFLKDISRGMEFFIQQLNQFRVDYKEER